MIAALALAVDHFFVREHSTEGLAPVHRHFGEVRQAVRIDEVLFVGHVRGNRQLADRPALLQLRVVPGVVNLEEDPLGPAEVVRVGGVDFALPIVAEAERFDLPAEVVDIVLGVHARVFAGGDGVLLRGQTERVPAHRVQHVEAAHTLEARENIRGGVALRMADVQSAATGVREHVEDVVLRLPRDARVVGIGRAEGSVGFPIGLPARFDIGGVVARHSKTSVKSVSVKIRRIRLRSPGGCRRPNISSP